MARLILLVGTLCALLSLPSVAFAQSGAALPSDPEAGSPSGTVYELPLDRARGDAAPRRGSRRGPGGNGGSGGPQQQRGVGIRSENGFGSSSQVPGQGDAGDSLGGRGAAAREKQSSANSADRGDASGGPLAAAAGADQVGVSQAASAFGSGGLTLALLALLLAVGTLVGLAAGRARRRRLDA